MTNATTLYTFTTEYVDAMVRIMNDGSFVIMGEDDNLVVDSELLQMAEGQAPEGWVLAS